MHFPTPLIPGKLIKRYKRFLADVELDSGEVITAHTPNTGSMLGLTDPGNPVWLSWHNNPKRKLQYTLEIIQVGPVLVGVNTGLPNKLAAEAIHNGTIKELQSYDRVRHEVKYGQNSRIDLLLEKASGKRCYVEVKNVTLVENGIAYFPDAVSARGQKHLLELQAMVRQGHRAVMLYIAQRSDAKVIAPADHIDPKYAELLREVSNNGVEALGYQALIDLAQISLQKALPVTLFKGNN